jgi:1-phosphofructokinase family hexose kinase
VSLIYCTLLNPALDSVYSIDSFVSGSTLHNVPSHVYPAGKGINVANVVRILGEEVCVIGCVPERDQQRFISYAESCGMQQHFFLTPGDCRMNVTIIEQKERVASHINSAGGVLPPRVQDEFLQFLAARLAAGDQCCFSGSLPRGFDDDAYVKMIKICAEARADTFLDTRDQPLRLGVRAKPLVLKPNIAELEALFDEQIKGVHHIALKGKKLLDSGVSFVFISLGSDGMIALHESDCLLCTPPQVKSIDTVGCGDALMGGILTAWKRKFSFSEMCRLAVASGASKAMHEGPHGITREEVWQLMEDVRITAI